MMNGLLIGQGVCPACGRQSEKFGSYCDRCEEEVTAMGWPRPLDREIYNETAAVREYRQQVVTGEISDPEMEIRLNAGPMTLTQWLLTLFVIGLVAWIGTEIFWWLVGN